MLIKKFYNDIKKNGLRFTIDKTVNYVKSTSKLKFTSFVLGLKSRTTNDVLIVKHGKYKFPFYNDGDFAELLYHAKWKEFYKEEREKIESYVEKGSAAIDVGGNLGFYSLILSELVGDEGKVYTFEPSPECYRKLSKTISVNNLKNVEIFNLGLGEDEKKAELYYNPNQTGLSSIVQKVSDNVVAEEIKLTTLDKFAEKIDRKISLIKIDTEGYEPQVLSGGRKLFAEHKPVLCIELGGKYIESSLKVLEILKEFNYQCEAFDVDLTQVPPGTNFIALPKQ